MRPEIPSVTIELDRPRRLVYTFESMQRAQDVLGTPAPDFTGPQGMLHLPGFLWACLAPEDQDLELVQLQRNLTPAMIPAMIAKIETLVKESMPEVNLEGNVPAPARKKAARR